MKKKDSSKFRPGNAKTVLITAVLLIVCLFFEAVLIFFGNSSNAYASEPISESMYNTSSNDILLWKMSSLSRSSLQELINTDFCDDPLNGTIQSYVMGIINDPLLDPDFYYYTNALTDALNGAADSGTTISPASLQKSLITLQMCLGLSGSDIFSCVSEEVLDNAFENSIGRRGLMTYIYGLKLLNAVDTLPDNTSFSREELTMYLMNLQLSDGGFSLSGNEGDVDVTAMLLQAVAPEYLIINSQGDEALGGLVLSFTDKEASTVKNGVEKALAFLENGQLENGDFGSMGTACSESTAQVILALTALQMSPDTFVSSNGCTAYDGLMLYLTDEGGFRHAEGLPVNDLASSQSFEALAALLGTSQFSGEAIPNLFIDDLSEAASDNNVSGASRSGSDNEISGASRSGPGIFSIKTILLIVLGALYLVSVLITVLKYVKKNKKTAARGLSLRILSLTLICGLLIFAVFNIRIQSVNSYKNSESDIIFSKESEDTISVTVSISCATVSDKTGISDIYPATMLYVKEGSTAFDVLSEICRLNDIQLDYDSDNVYGVAYIKGINSLYELDYGDLSGWMYRVNGEFPSVGCGYYKLTDGCTMEWLYTTDLGNDLGQNHGEGQNND